MCNPSPIDFNLIGLYPKTSTLDVINEERLHNCLSRVACKCYQCKQTDERECCKYSIKEQNWEYIRVFAVHAGFVRWKFEPLPPEEGSSQQGVSNEWKYTIISQVPRVEQPRHSRSTIHLFGVSWFFRKWKENNDLKTGKDIYFFH